MRLKKDGTPAKKPGRKVDPNKPVKIKRGRKGPRPHVWKCGDDEYKHSMYEPWMKARAQANFRKETWTLTFEEYYDLWKEDWNHRGRGSDDICMTRKDVDGAWDKKNTILMTRKEHLKRCGKHLKEIRGTANRVPSGKPSGRPRKNEIVYTKLKVMK